MDRNPYAPPTAAVADVAVLPRVDGEFLPQGRRVGIGRGWAWIAAGWRLFRERPGTWIVGVLLMCAVMIALAVIPILGAILMPLLWPILFGGIMASAESVRSTGSLALGQFLAGFHDRLGALATIGLLSLACSLAVNLLIASLAGLGPLYFLNPGSELPPDVSLATYFLATLTGMAISIPYYAAIWFSPALIQLNGMRPGEALKTSFFACVKNVLVLVVFGMLMTMLLMASVIPLGLGLLITMRLYVISMYTAYRDIFYAT